MKELFPMLLWCCFNVPENFELRVCDNLICFPKPVEVLDKKFATEDDCRREAGSLPKDENKFYYCTEIED